MTTLILDTETTDATDGELIEAAYVTVGLDANSHLHAYGYAFEQRYKPTKPISFGAMATHHILEHELVDCPGSDTFALPAGVDYLIGHGIDFDWQIVGSPEVKRICTLAMARNLWPGISHTLGALMYMLSPDPAWTREKLRDAHSALADVYFCATLLDAILEKAGPFESMEKLWEFSEAARVPTVITFGKHKGTAIADLPTDYVLWMLRQDDVDPYLRKALEGRVQKRLVPA
jgi:exodeoxyribonuclease X